ncbi:hypothetical protein PVAP13_9KG075100 [Panicum virgatum]|uniref:Uncharacterized protein n=1 Tax=Panicum virgatum TaxID=38727 RepID=A0A8T0NGK8_PANVG|nr:hypothetical protein PVAP13_9KG075100 [Panicum virgatum]
MDVFQYLVRSESPARYINPLPLPLPLPPQVPSPHPRLFPAPTVLTPTASGRFTASPQFPIPKRSPARRNPNPSRRRCRRAMAAAAECRDEVGLEERLIDDRGSRDLEEEEHGVPRRPRPHPPRSRVAIVRWLPDSWRPREPPLRAVQIHHAPRRRVG